MMLSGIRIVDISQYIPGPYCSKMLGDLGANVIKIMKHGSEEKDAMSHFTPGVFEFLNDGKKIVELDLKASQDKVIFLDIIRKCDVFIEGFRPGVVHRLGIDYKNIKNINSTIIYCSISGFGQESIYKDIPAHDINILAMSGLLNLRGDYNPTPTRPSIPLADISAAMFASISILGGLFDRKKTGKGTFIDISMLNCIIHWISLRTMGILGEEKSTDRLETHISPWNHVYKCGDDKMFAIGLVENKFRNTFSKYVSSVYSKYLNTDTTNDNIYKELKDIFILRSSDDWNSIFQKADLPGSIVREPAEVFSVDSLKRLGILGTKKENGTAHTIKFPVKFT